MGNLPVDIGKFLDPEAIIKQLEILPGCSVADFGCGPGFFSIPFSQKTGEDGKVYSFDILPQALEAVASKVKTLGISNITLKRANLEKENGSSLPAGGVDWVIMKDMLFQNKNKEAIIAEAQRVLKNGGKALIIEWGDHEYSIGPDNELRVSEDAVRKMLDEAGFSIEKNIDAGGFHWALLAVKK